jgi:hypothetical protein
MQEISFLSDGALLLTGTDGDGSTGTVAARFDADVILDETYAQQGILTLPNNPGTQAHDGSGGFYIAGVCPSCDQRITHIDARGDLDSGFGTAGEVTAADLGVDRFVTIERAADGLWLLALRGRDPYIFRLLPGGRIDGDFGYGGEVHLGFAWEDSTFGLADDPFGGGFFVTNLGAAWLYGPDGLLADGFLDIYPGNDEAEQVFAFTAAVGADRLFLAGTSFDLEVARVAAFDRTGALDWIQSCDAEACGDVWVDLEVDGQGRLLITEDRGPAIWRLEKDGDYDACFGNIGRLALAKDGALSGLTVDSNGDIWVTDSGGNVYRIAAQVDR